MNTRSISRRKFIRNSVVTALGFPFVSSLAFTNPHARENG